MWHDNLLALINESGLNKHEIAERGNLPYETVKRVVNKKTLNPYIETLDRFAMALGCTLSDILIGTRAVVGNDSLSTLQANIDTITLERDTIMAERDLVIAENTILKDKVSVLTAENELLKLQLAHKEEIIAIHNYYCKFKQEV